MQTRQLSRLMRISWEIQRRRNHSRSKSLCDAWVIFLNEDITVHHLTLKHSHERYVNKPQTGSLSLF